MDEVIDESLKLEEAFTFDTNDIDLEKKNNITELRK